MTAALSPPPTVQTLGDLLARLGDVPLARVRFQPRPGTATVRDVIDLADQSDILCELVDGVLLEKAVGYVEAALAVCLVRWIDTFVTDRNLGIVTGPDGTVQLMPGLVRIPDVAFTSWTRLPGRRLPTAPVPLLAPNLAVEVLSRSNTPGEMSAKRRDYFGSGVELVWEIDPDTRAATVYVAEDRSTRLTAADALEGGSVLPGLAVPLSTVFAVHDRHG